MKEFIIIVQTEEAAWNEKEIARILIGRGLKVKNIKEKPGWEPSGR